MDNLLSILKMNITNSIISLKTQNALLVWDIINVFTTFLSQYYYLCYHQNVLSNILSSVLKKKYYYQFCSGLKIIILILFLKPLIGILKYQYYKFVYSANK